MKALFAVSMAALAALATSPAVAQDNEGKIQIKVLGTGVLPDGKITSVNTDIVGLPADTQTKANDNYVPTIAIEYFFNDNFSKPYVGAGPAYFLWISDKPGAATLPLGVTDTDLSDEFGFALQVGFDVPINDEGFGLTVDAKRYFVDTTARWYAGDTLAIETDHKLDPWVVSAGVSYRF